MSTGKGVPVASSYRHSKYAGNHGDVIKHIVIVQVLQDAVRCADQSVVFADTHAGIGYYTLDKEKGEHQNGFHRVSTNQASDVPSCVDDYLSVVRQFNNSDDSEIERYPGSPALAKMLLRQQDEHMLWELVPSQHQALASFMEGDSRSKLFCEDGFRALSLVDDLLSEGKRHIVLIDPPYKDANDYAQTCSVVKEVLMKRPSSTILVWIPQLEKNENKQFHKDIVSVVSAANAEWLEASITIAQRGLLGSSMMVVNPPESLYETLKPTLPWLATVMDQDCSFHSLRASDAVGKSN